MTMKYYRTILGVSAVTGILAQVSAAATEAETMAILEQGGGSLDGLLIIGALLALSGVWMYFYCQKKKKRSRRHHHHHHSSHTHHS